MIGCHIINSIFCIPIEASSNRINIHKKIYSFLFKTKKLLNKIVIYKNLIDLKKLTQNYEIIFLFIYIKLTNINEIKSRYETNKLGTFNFLRLVPAVIK